LTMKTACGGATANVQRNGITHGGRLELLGYGKATRTKQTNAFNFGYIDTVSQNMDRFYMQLYSTKRQHINE